MRTSNTPRNSQYGPTVVTVRMAPAAHRRLRIAAAVVGQSMNVFAREAIERAVDEIERTNQPPTQGGPRADSIEAS